MKKAAKIMSIIAGVFAILLAVAMLISSAFYAFIVVPLEGVGTILNTIMGLMRFGEDGNVIFSFDNVFNTSDPTTSILFIITSVIDVIAIIATIILAVEFLAGAVLALVLGILGLIGSKERTKKGLRIAIIVVDVLFALLVLPLAPSFIIIGGTVAGFIIFAVFVLFLVAQILGLVAISKEKKAKEQLRGIQEVR